MGQIVGKRCFQKNKKEPVVGIEPTTGALRMRYSTSELHRLIDCSRHVINVLAVRLTLAIIPFAYSPCQAFLHPSLYSYFPM